MEGWTGRPRRRRGWALLPTKHTDELALAHDDQRVAIVTIGITAPPAARDIVERAHRAGHMVAVAGDPRLARALHADLEVDGGTRLADAVTTLQADGCVVMLVAPGNAGPCAPPTVASASTAAGWCTAPTSAAPTWPPPPSSSKARRSPTR